MVVLILKSAFFDIFVSLLVDVVYTNSCNISLWPLSLVSVLV